MTKITLGERGYYTFPGNGTSRSGNDRTIETCGVTEEPRTPVISGEVTVNVYREVKGTFEIVRVPLGQPRLSSVLHLDYYNKCLILSIHISYVFGIRPPFIFSDY